MNSEYVNPFIQGSQDVLTTICGESPSLGKVFLKRNAYSWEPVSIMIAILGDIKGNVIYTMKENVACDIVSKMMCGMPVPELDEMGKSAISELANMISGNVATIFSNAGKIVDITPPTCTINAQLGDYPFVQEGSNMICVPLQFQDGSIFEVDILLKD